jgi:protease-4
VAIVHAEGAIVSGDSDQQLFGGRMVGDRSMRKLLSDLREDEDVAAVVLRVNSPGGSGLASDNIWRELERLKAAEKPIVVSMGDYAASGGYYIAAPADWIVAQPGTLTGSIGVFGGKINLAGAWENLGVTSHTWQRGRMAMLLSPMADFSEEERGKFKSFLQSFYDVFLDRVASGRDLERADVDAIAQGRVWTGEQALERKLVDELGGLDEALARARELAHLGDDVRIERFPKRRTFLEQIMDDLENRQARAAVAALPEPLRSAWADASVVARVLEGTGVAAMLPFVVRED